jgi:hypothetical protein
MVQVKHVPLAITNCLPAETLAFVVKKSSAAAQLLYLLARQGPTLDLQKGCSD